STNARPKHIRSSHGSQVAVAAAVPSIGLTGGDHLLREGLALVGTPYIWGGTSPRGFDCSGFTYYLFARLGIRIPRTADAQFAAGRPIFGDPLPGDLVFFQTYDYGASHVGVYLGDGRFVNSIGSNVHIASFASPYFRSRYIGARRFLPG
ncbi:MAG: C40 family peptidase, partial [Candidatus Eremiobacteraeota bacterium]|nr:C40 family peptidase [Candidatus Eremiobacteraeota bacterium]